MSPGSNTENYPAFAHIGLRENPGKNLNQVTCPDQESNPGHLVSRLDVLTVTPQMWTSCSGRQHSLKCAKGKRCRPVCTVVQQEEVESIPASSYECTMVHRVFAVNCPETGLDPTSDTNKASLMRQLGQEIMG
ncbi:hypothetical protein ANN_11732 [Periplaneta americana]|uniref:Uncharacterized protein n=1 Tax=Periplaneta americana TaxID=6978 RepID=A0ABQ8T7P5_PERAM|nr:hypothetical protein ANN_11732 [Periplaneta americana]